MHHGLPKIDAQTIASYDLVVVTASHTTLDYASIAANARWVFDTKNALKQVKNRENIVLL